MTEVAVRTTLLLTSLWSSGFLRKWETLPFSLAKCDIRQWESKGLREQTSGASWVSIPTWLKFGLIVIGSNI